MIAKYGRKGNSVLKVCWRKKLGVCRSCSTRSTQAKNLKWRRGSQLILVTRELYSPENGYTIRITRHLEALSTLGQRAQRVVADAVHAVSAAFALAVAFVRVEHVERVVVRGLLDDDHETAGGDVQAVFAL